MKARAAIRVGASPGGGWSLAGMSDCPPLALRRSGGCLYVVSSAAHPLGGDDLELHMTVGGGVDLEVRSSAATVAWTANGSRQLTELQVAEEAKVAWLPEPVIATGRCRHEQVANVWLEGLASLFWREVLVLGRVGEACGQMASELNLVVDGRARLRHRLEVGKAVAAWDGPAVLGSAKVVGLALVAWSGPVPEWVIPQARPTVGPGSALTPLEGPGWVAMALGQSVTDVTQALGSLIAGCARWPQHGSTPGSPAAEALVSHPGGAGATRALCD